MKSKFVECRCGYCVEGSHYTGFPSVWRIAEDKLWIEIPKNGSAFMKHHFQVPFHRGVVNDKVTRNEYDTNEIPWVIVRDPIERFSSLVRHYTWGSRKNHLRNFYSGDVSDTNSLIECFIEKCNTLGSNVEGHHFHPQCYFVRDLGFKSLNIVHLKDAGKVFYPEIDVDKVSDYHLNRGGGYGKIEFDEGQIKRIKEKYIEDYEFFGKIFS